MKLFDRYWYNALADQFNQPYFNELANFINEEKKKGKLILPFAGEEFFAFDMTSLDSVSVVMIGQDPYADMHLCQGVAFSCPSHKPIPGSLKNIFRELKSDLGIENTKTTLFQWCIQGVLMLNTVLTVENGKPGSHAGKGWEHFTDAVVKAVAERGVPTVYILMGKSAKAKRAVIEEFSDAPYLIIDTAHPSPRSAHQGFFWTKPFSKANAFLKEHGLKEIDWRT